MSLKRNSTAFARSVLWPDRTMPDKSSVFTPAGALTKPLELPHVFLLPSANIYRDVQTAGPRSRGISSITTSAVSNAASTSGSGLPPPTGVPALASNMGVELPFCCHTKPHARDPDKKCRGTDICSNNKCNVSRVKHGFPA